MKARFDGLDVTAMVAVVALSLTGRRVVNVYDGDSGDTYLLKLDAGDSSSNNNSKSGENVDNKAFLLLESGIRFHPIAHFSSQGMPSPFCAKLRKHLRGLRLEQVQQVGTDRVVLLHFGVGQARHTIVLELYAKGNLMLTNREFRILALLRSHVYQQKKDSSKGGAGGDEDKDEPAKTKEIAAAAAGEEDVAVQVGRVYPVSYATTVKTSGTAANDTAASSSDDDAVSNKEAGEIGMLSDKYQEWIAQALLGQQSENHSSNTQQQSYKKKKKKKSLSLKTLLLKPDSGLSQYGPALIEHCILKAGLSPHESLAETEMQDVQWQHLRSVLKEEGQRVLRDLGMGTCEGHILYEPQKKTKTEQDDSNAPGVLSAADSEMPHADKILLEFFPHLFLQHASKPILTYTSFGSAVADFYAQLARQKQLLRGVASENAAQQRLEKIRLDQQERLVALQRDQVHLRRQAQAVQNHADSVEKALTVINSALDSGMDWDQLEQVVQVEQQKRNPIALLIQRLDLEQDAMILRLPTDDQSHLPNDNDDDDDDDNAETDPFLDVKISLKESAHANASSLFSKYRANKEKAAKTIESSTKALQAAEENAMRQLQDAQKRNKTTHTGGLLVAKRKPAWYEKFHWFITTDNYLVLAGRDAHQNELLVKRYLRAGDAYLHADVHGAASCILRAKRRQVILNKSGGGAAGGTTTTSRKTEPVPLSDQALREAGSFTICRSSAWSSRMITSAWWVEAHQVSKTAQTGEYLTVGSFVVRGRKNFLPPSPLEMGLAILFRLGDDDSIARHKTDRRDFALIALESSPLENDNIEEIIMPSKDKNAKYTEAKGSVRESPITSSPVAVKETRKKEEDKEAEVEVELETVSEESAASLDVDEDQEEHPAEADALDSSKAASSDGGSMGNNETQQPKKKGLSARDRRLIKKHGSLEEAERVLAAKEGKVSQSTNQVPSPAVANASTSPNQQGSMKRGKKSKMKRAKKKYSDQDEEDKDLAMLALQGGETDETEKKEEGTTEAQRNVAAETTALLVKDASEAAANLPDDVRSILAECVTVKTGDGEEGIRWDKFDADTIEQLAAVEPEEAQVAAANRLLNLKANTRIDNFSASLSGIIRAILKYGHENLNNASKDASSDKTKRKTKEEKIAEETKWRETMAEEGIADSDNEEDGVDDTIELNKLTGKPQPDDLLLYAVPVCAPYQTLSQYSFRVKLTPGNMKRGKAAKQCAEMLVRGDNTKPAGSRIRDQDLIKKINDNDWVQTICSDVKISAPGASKTTKKQNVKSKKKK